MPQTGKRGFHRVRHTTRHTKTRSYREERKRERMTNSERLMTLAGNLKNWDWSVYPQFKLEKEDAEALQELLKTLDIPRKILER